MIHYELRHEEQQMICLLKEGDGRAYQYLYDRYYTLLCAIAYEYMGDRFLSENLVDELIFHLWEKRETLEITASLRSYLMRAIRNRCINALQRERREIAFSSMNANEYEMILSPESGDYPLAVLLENELEGKISQAIENLPPEYRRIFMMSRFENKPYGQIAEETGISVNTVKYYIKNALLRLKDELQVYLK
ncbi:MAG: RNA polymerase sigma-70 factor [Tannerella sp.]|nr:RNA polymerase sigma-70 factor [Tannerella sp.]